MKYIDAEQLSKKIESIGLYVQKSADYNDGRNDMKMMVLDIIDSLRQEQPMPSCKSCGFYENNCPFIRDTFKPYPNKVCKDYTYSIMKEQKHTEVDLDEKINRFWDSCIKHKNERGGNVIWSNKIEIEALARYFYELGFKIKKEE